MSEKKEVDSDLFWLMLFYMVTGMFIVLAFLTGAIKIPTLAEIEAFVWKNLEAELILLSGAIGIVLIDYRVPRLTTPMAVHKMNNQLFLEDCER